MVLYQLGSRAGAEAAAQPPRSGIGRERVSTWQSVLLMPTDIPIASASGCWGAFPPSTPSLPAARAGF